MVASEVQVRIEHRTRRKITLEPKRVSSSPAKYNRVDWNPPSASKFTPKENAKLERAVTRFFSSSHQFRIFLLVTGGGITALGVGLYVWKEVEGLAGDGPLIRRNFLADKREGLRRTGVAPDFLEHLSLASGQRPIDQSCGSCEASLRRRAE